MSEESFELVSSICKDLGSRAEHDGIESLSALERTALYVWWATGIIDNGGFQYFYETASEAAEVADAFDMVGITGPAKACRDSLTAFPGGVPPTDREERIATLDALTDSQRKTLEDLSEVIWEASEHGLEDVLARFIEANRSAFPNPPHGA